MFGEHKHKPIVETASDGKSDFHRIMLNIIYVLIIISLLLPIASMIGTLSFVNMSFRKSFKNIDKDPIITQIENANENNGIVSLKNTQYLKTLYDKLEASTVSHEIAKLSTRVNIVFADFNENASSQENKLNFIKKTNKDGKLLLDVTKATRVIELDLEQIDHSGFVIISNRPILLDIKNQSPETIGRMGVENKHAFDIINQTEQVLAGFRVEAFNSYSAISPRNLKAQEKSMKRRSRFCRAILDWIKFFDVEISKIKLWHAINPSGLKLKPKSVKSTYIQPVRQKDLVQLCFMKKW
jgi:chemotaxis signal transduction protein